MDPSVRLGSMGDLRLPGFGLISIFLVGIFAFVLKILYNIYFHPLSKFKGPKYLTASDISLSALQLHGTAHYTLREAHEQYGQIVRIAPSTLSFTDPSAWKDIYGSRNGRTVLPKDPQFYNDMLADRNTILMASEDDAIALRKAMNPAFSHKALLDQESRLKSHIQRLIGQLTKASFGNRSVDIHKWIVFSLFDINSDFAFGEDMGCVASGRFHEWVQFVVDYFYAATVLHQCHKFPPLDKALALCIPKSLMERRKRHDEASLERVRRRLNTDTGRRDFMHYFAHHARKEGLSTSMIEAQSSVIILAGSETTSIPLTAAVYRILSNARVYDRLCGDIRGAFRTEEDILLRDVIPKLPYLDAVVQETLRLHAPLANGLTRLVADPEGAMISGTWVPRGTIVVISHYCCNTSTRNFREPFSFVPERWLGDPAYSDDKRDVVQPFSVGPRNCLGKTLALNNIKLVLAHLIWSFDMELDERAKDWTIGQKAYNDWIQPELPVLLKRRR